MMRVKNSFVKTIIRMLHILLETVFSKRGLIKALNVLFINIICKTRIIKKKTIRIGHDDRTFA